MSAELELARLEAAVLQSASIADFLALVDELRRLLADGDADLGARILALVPPNVTPDLTSATSSAYAAGVRDAATIIDEGRPRLRREEPPRSIARAIVEAQQSVADDIERARRLAFAGIDAETALAPAFAASNTVKRSVTALVNQAGNAGSTAVADAAGYPTVWIAETNACVHCLAYSGRVAEPGEKFEGGLTYGPKSYHPEPLPHPPLHPHCRCTVEPLRVQEFADGLRREADRSVLRGFSLESESMKVRIDAARRLLEDPDLVAPRSVIDFARRAVKRGEFTTRGRP